MINNPFYLQPEMRYGAPVCDEIFTGRHFTIGYSWYFRQAKWALEIINRDRELINATDPVERKDHFRADVRVPRRFRAALGAYRKSGYHRGHLVGSANQNLQEIQNSETFLLSNMAPQVGSFNSGIWARLERAVRRLDAREDILETYVLTAPVFDFTKPIEMIGDRNNKYGIDIPIPHAFVKSVLAENSKGALLLWTFQMENKKLSGDLKDYLVKTYDAEQMVGGRFWDRVSGGDIHDQKRIKNKTSYSRMWR